MSAITASQGPAADACGNHIFDSRPGVTYSQRARSESTERDSIPTRIAFAISHRLEIRLDVTRSFLSLLCGANMLGSCDSSGCHVTATSSGLRGGDDEYEGMSRFKKPGNPWWVVGGGAVATMFGVGPIMVYAYGILSLGLIAEHGWSRDALATGFSSFLLGNGIGLAALGWLISRHGISRPSGIFVALFGVGFAAVSILPPSPALFAVVLLLVGIGGAACTSLPYAVSISGFFDAKRGLALGIVVAGSGAGAAFLPQLAQWLSNSYSWRAGFWVIGLLATVIPLLVLTLLVRTPPGATQAAKAASSALYERRSAREVFWGNRSFWLVFAAILAVSLATFGGMGSLVPLFSDNGFDKPTIATILSLVGFSSWVGRLVVGFLLDRIFAPYLTATILCFAAAGLVLLLVSTSPFVAFIAAMFVGLAMGAEADLLTFLVSRYFRLSEFSRVTSVIWVVWSWSGAVGTALAAASFAKFGSYAPAFMVFAFVLLVAVSLILRLGPYISWTAAAIGQATPVAMTLAQPVPKTVP